MSRYIDAELIDQTCDWYEHEFPECEYIIRLIQEDIRKMPSVEVKRGRWIYNANFAEPPFKCSACGKSQGRLSNYCPNCGAKMEENDDHHD